MDFKVRERKSRLINFMKNLEHSIDVSNWEEEDISKFIFKSLLGKGNEGSVYTSKFKVRAGKTPNVPFVTKIVNYKKISESKDISKLVLSSTANDIYKLFTTEEAFNKPSLMELLSMTMTNQLILQNVCPNYCMNFYWDVNSHKKHIIMYNELANMGDYNDWATRRHSLELWYNAYFQVFAGLYALKKYFNMLHTDFHTNNILVHKVKPGGYWKYIIDEKDYYVPNLGYVFLIHDFGFGWIPNGIGVKWHTKNMYKLNNVKREFFDVFTFIESLWYDDYKTPKKFVTSIADAFAKELEYLDEETSSKRRAKQMQTVQSTIGDKIAEIYRGAYHIDYSVRPKKDNKIETYSLDKELDKNYLPRHLRRFCIRQKR